MKKVALVALLLSAVIMGFSAPKALIGGAFGINATNPIYQPERWGAGALDLSLQLPFTEKIGTTLSAQAAVRYPTNKIGLLNADIYFQIFEIFNLKLRLLVSVASVMDSNFGEPGWMIGPWCWLISTRRRLLLEAATTRPSIVHAWLQSKPRFERSPASTSIRRSSDTPMPR